jgi:hypothetical protein
MPQQMFEHTLKRLIRAKDKKAAQSFIQDSILDPSAPFANEPRKINVKLRNGPPSDISEERGNLADPAYFNIGSLTSSDDGSQCRGCWEKVSRRAQTSLSLKLFRARNFCFRLRY